MHVNVLDGEHLMFEFSFKKVVYFFYVAEYDCQNRNQLLLFSVYLFTNSDVFDLKLQTLQWLLLQNIQYTGTIDK